MSKSLKRFLKRTFFSSSRSLIDIQIGTLLELLAGRLMQPLKELWAWNFSGVFNLFSTLLPVTSMSMKAKPYTVCVLRKTCRFWRSKNSTFQAIWRWHNDRTRFNNPVTGGKPTSPCPHSRVRPKTPSSPLALAYNTKKTTGKDPTWDNGHFLAPPPL